LANELSKEALDPDVGSFIMQEYFEGVLTKEMFFLLQFFSNLKECMGEGRKNETKWSFLRVFFDSI
jgi:hypothetical protein